MTSLRVHAIGQALNDDISISQQLETLYPYCAGAGISQYD